MSAGRLMPMERGKALVVAVALAPLVQFLASFLALAMPPFGLHDALTTALIAFAGSYGVLVAIGLPSHLILQRAGVWKLRHYNAAALLTVWTLLAVVGTVGGNAQGAVGDEAGAKGITATIMLALLGTPFVLFCTTVFWKIAVAPFAVTDRQP